jgi:hypothetical protein
MNYKITIINKYDRKKVFNKYFLNQTLLKSYEDKIIKNGGKFSAQKINSKSERESKNSIALSILSKKRNVLRNIHCIYALIKNDEVVYIGQSSSIMGRLQQHIAECRKDFDSYAIVEWLDTHSTHIVNEKERFYIEKLKPTYNVIHNKKSINKKKKPKKQDSHIVFENGVYKRKYYTKNNYYKP